MLCLIQHLKLILTIRCSEPTITVGSNNKDITVTVPFFEETMFYDPTVSGNGGSNSASSLLQPNVVTLLGVVVNFAYLLFKW